LFDMAIKLSSVASATVLAGARRIHTRPVRISALPEAGNVRRWSRGSRGQLGHGNTHEVGDDELPANACDMPYR
jgi:hypothetical protein